MMRRSVISVLLGLLCSVAALAQGPGKRFDPEDSRRDVRLDVGIFTPIKGSGGSETMLGASYARFRSGGLGFRVGVQYMPCMFDCDDFVCFPVALAYRTGLRSASESAMTGLMASAWALQEWLWDWWRDADDLWESLIAAFLVGAVNRGEFFVGVTPGYLFGDSSLSTTYYPSQSAIESRVEGIRKNTGMYLSIDAGYTMTWRIWRFGLHATPAFHYSVINSVRDYQRTEYVRSGPEVISRPMRWNFSFCGGLSWMF